MDGLSGKDRGQMHGGPRFAFLSLGFFVASGKDLKTPILTRKNSESYIKLLSGWWFQMFFIFAPIPGEMIQFDEHIFQMGRSTNN